MAALDENDILVEPMDGGYPPFDVESSSLEADEIPVSYTGKIVDLPLNIEIDKSGKIKEISSKMQSDLNFEVYILQNGELLISYNSVLANNAAETSKLERTSLAENTKYFISIVVANKDSIDSYDGYFSIIDSEMVFDYLFYNSADIASLNGPPVIAAAQHRDTISFVL